MHYGVNNTVRSVLEVQICHGAYHNKTEQSLHCVGNGKGETLPRNRGKKRLCCATCMYLHAFKNLSRILCFSVAGPDGEGTSATSASPTPDASTGTAMGRRGSASVIPTGEESYAIKVMEKREAKNVLSRCLDNPNF